MKKASNILVSLIITLVLSAMVYGVFAEDKLAAPPDGPPNGGFDKMVQNLSEQGFDAQLLLNEFWKNNPDERPAPPNQGEKTPQE